MSRAYPSASRSTSISNIHSQQPEQPSPARSRPSTSGSQQKQAENVEEAWLAQILQRAEAAAANSNAEIEAPWDRIEEVPRGSLTMRFEDVLGGATASTVAAAR
jgi:hypothetical protein